MDNFWPTTGFSGYNGSFSCEHDNSTKSYPILMNLHRIVPCWKRKIPIDFCNGVIFGKIAPWACEHDNWTKSYPILMKLNRIVPWHRIDFCHNDVISDIISGTISPHDNSTVFEHNNSTVFHPIFTKLGRVDVIFILAAVRLRPPLSDPQVTPTGFLHSSTGWNIIPLKFYALHFFVHKTSMNILIFLIFWLI